MGLRRTGLTRGRVQAGAGVAKKIRDAPFGKGNLAREQTRKALLA